MAGQSNPVVIVPGSLTLDLNRFPRGAKSTKRCTLDLLKTDGSVRQMSIFRNRRIKGWWPFTRKNDDQEFELTVSHSLAGFFQASFMVGRQFVPSDNSSQATIRPKRQFVPSDNSSQATIRPKRQFVPSDNSSQIPKSDNSSQASIRPILKRRQFVPFVKSDNSSQIV